jgi:hypothetical protein
MSAKKSGKGETKVELAWIILATGLSGAALTAAVKHKNPRSNAYHIPGWTLFFIFLEIMCYFD